MIDLLIDELFGEFQLSLWFAIGGLLMILGEALIPGGPLIVVGTALLAAGVTGELFGISDLLPLTVLLGVYGTITFAGFRHFEVYGSRGRQTSEVSSLDGDKGVVKDTVTAGDGRIKLDSGGFNPYYGARSHTGERIPEGTRVRVVDPGGGNVLEVEPISDETEPKDTDADTDSDSRSENE